MSKEPKSPKGEKASERFWKSEGNKDGDFLWCISPKDKAYYDKLVSLEAKIELLEHLTEGKEDYDYEYVLLTEAKSKYSELLKEHNL